MKIRKKNMEDALFYCNSTVSLISSIQIRLTELMRENADILITDDVKGASEIAARMKRLKLFRKVIYVKGRNFEYKGAGRLKHLAKIIKANFDDAETKRYIDLLGNDKRGWDILYFYDYNLFLCALYDLSLSENRSVRCVRFDEGILCYPNLDKMKGKRILINEMLRKLRKKSGLLPAIQMYEIFLPEVLKEFVTSARILKKIEEVKRNGETHRILNELYCFSISQFIFPQRYIYFSSPYRNDGIEVDDTDLLNQLAKRLGKENIIVKSHPRDRENKYEKQGFCIIRDSYIPWEIVQMNKDFRNKVFLSLTSASIVNAQIMFNETIEAYYLFPCIKTNDLSYISLCKKVSGVLKVLQSKGICLKTKIINDISSIPFYQVS